MTVQASDYVLFENKPFTLIDIEKDKQIIDCAEFTFDTEIDEEKIAQTTACWRGYTAEYSIENDILYGIKMINLFIDGEYLEVLSRKTKINFSGSCIIAFENDDDSWPLSDFLPCYLDFGEAYELYFENGHLVEKHNLASAIEKFIRIEDTKDYKSLTPQERDAQLEKIAQEPLKYSYSDSSYKWRCKE